MLKARAVTDDGELLVLGLSEKNLTRLCADDPILVELEPMGGSGAVVIAYARTPAEVEQAIAFLRANLRPHTGVVLFIGLTEEILQRLREHRTFDCTALGHRIMIFYGGTEQEMRREFARFIGPHTQYSDTTQMDS